MKRKILLVVTFSIVLVTVTGLSGCDIDKCGGTVLVTNNSNKSFKGKVWTDSHELFDGTIRAWNTKTFHVSEECTVYTYFESDNGGKSNPSGYVSRYRTLVLDL